MTDGALGMTKGAPGVKKCHFERSEAESRNLFNQFCILLPSAACWNRCAASQNRPLDKLGVTVGRARGDSGPCSG